MARVPGEPSHPARLLPMAGCGSGGARCGPKPHGGPQWPSQSKPHRPPSHPGHGRVEAAKLLGVESVPTLRLSHLTEAQRRAYVIADNKLAQNAGWDRDVLAIELQALIEVEFDIELTGFSLAEVDILLDDAKESSPGAPAEGEDEIPPLPDQNSAVTGLGDVWSVGTTPAHLRRLSKR